MFDVSFAEVLVLVTGAGLLLGRQEILQGSRMAGKMLGRGVGVLQGVRIRYEEKTRGSRVHQMHSNVKMGLRDMNTIGMDLAMVGTGMPTPSQLSTGAVAPANASTHTNRVTATTAGKQMHGSSSSSTTTGFINSDNAFNSRLARLILAEEKLQGGQEWSHSITSNSSTVDVVQSAITGSIMNEFYAREMAKEEARVDK
jgi:hypothetical protein